jgi:hypothetical protein
MAKTKHSNPRQPGNSNRLASSFSMTQQKGCNAGENDAG